MATRRDLEKYSVRCNQICTQIRKAESGKNICGLVHDSCQKRGNIAGYDGFKRITGTKIHVAVESNGLPVSIIISPANEHDGTRFIDTVENISEYLDDDSIKQIKKVYADKGYDAKRIREYLRKRNITDCIPYRNFKTKHNKTTQNRYNKTRYVVERFFAWLKCGFHRIRIRYERRAENYLGLINITSFLMYCRVLR